MTIIDAHTEELILYACSGMPHRVAVRREQYGGSVNDTLYRSKDNHPAVDTVSLATVCTIRVFQFPGTEVMKPRVHFVQRVSAKMIVM